MKLRIISMLGAIVIVLGLTTLLALSVPTSKDYLTLTKYLTGGQK